MSRTAVIFNIQRFSTHDGPGIRTTVFLKGCPLSCWWCHNPESQSFQPEVLYYEERCRYCGDCIAACPQHNIRDTQGIIETGTHCAHCGICAETCLAEARRTAGRTVTVQELLSEVEKDLVFFDDSGGGVTLSGGEPASHAEFSVEFLEACCERGIHTAIETCGVASLETLLRVASRANLVFFDLKAMDSETHRRYTGAPNGIILRNLKGLLDAGCRLVIRIPVVPGVNDSEAEIARFAGFLKSLPVAGIELLPFHRIGMEKYHRLGMPYRAAEIEEPSDAVMRHFQSVLSGAKLEVHIGGSK
jgi:pyruvate formate lyase activating enzyme